MGRKTTTSRYKSSTPTSTPKTTPTSTPKTTPTPSRIITQKVNPIGGSTNGSTSGGGGTISPTYMLPPTKIAFMATPIKSTESWLPSNVTLPTGASSGGFGHEGFTMLDTQPVPKKPQGSTMADSQYLALVEKVGVEQADKLALATYSTPQQIKIQYPATKADIQAELNELNKIDSFQRLEKVRVMSPTPTPTPTPTPKTTSAVISIFPFVIVGIVLIGILLFLRRRA